MAFTDSAIPQNFSDRALQWLCAYFGTEATYKYDARASLGATTARTVWAPATGKTPRVRRVQVTLDAAGRIEIRKGTAGSGATFLSFEFAGAGTQSFDFGLGELAANPNDVIEIYNPTAGALFPSCKMTGTEE